MLDLEVVDVDGAIREAEEAVAGDTRAGLFRKAAIGAGAVAGAGVFSALVPEAGWGRPSRRQDIAILKFALGLEYLEADYYTRAVSDGGLNGRALDIARLLADHERKHVGALERATRAFGGKVQPRPRFDFRDTISGDRFLPTAFTLENTGTRAYAAQAPRIDSRQLLAAAASIALIEGRHAAAIAMLLDRDPISDGDAGITPFGAFDKATSKRGILAEVRDTGYKRG